MSRNRETPRERGSLAPTNTFENEQTMEHEYKRIHGVAAPKSMTMERLVEMDELVVAQSTQLCLRQGCCRPSINWVLLDGSNYTPGSSPFDLPNVGGWIHEESTFVQRCCFGEGGCRETKFVHHAGEPPASMNIDDRNCCRIQTTPASVFLSPEDLKADIVAVHEKGMSCAAGCCCFTPYLRTFDGEGQFLGETRYVCDGYIFVPKFVVLDQYRQTKYLLRPDTCFFGLCLLPRCGGQGGKCCRLPFLVRDPNTYETVSANVHEGQAQVTQLWSGLANEVCFKRHAYHVGFPSDANMKDKLTLIGSSILVDVALFEKDDNGGGGGGG